MSIRLGRPSLLLLVAGALASSASCSDDTDLSPLVLTGTGIGDDASAPTPVSVASALHVSHDPLELTIDPSRGGEITDLRLFDGATWNRVLGGDGQTFPALTLRTAGSVLSLAGAKATRVETVVHTADLDEVRATAVLRAADGRDSDWEATLDYEIHRSGGLFVGVELRLLRGSATVTSAELGFVADRAWAASPKLRQEIIASSALPSARIAFGTNAARSFSNELQILVENAAPLGGGASGPTGNDARLVSTLGEPGRLVWHLTDGAASVVAPFRYTNRIVLGAGRAAPGRPRSNLVGQRPYHWVDDVDARKDDKGWYPTDLEIDHMADNGATMLVLHNLWMARGGANGLPHADYTTARDDGELRRVVQHAHARHLRVGLYSRGIERYGADAKFFERYLQRDWDGLYVDWHGAQAIAFHEHAHPPEPALGDMHASADGHLLPAREYALYMDHLRDVVGPQGFLIGHQGSFSAGVLANLAVDAYLSGEAPFDHGMLASVDEAVYRGMMGGGISIPWPAEVPNAFTTREAVAKMAAWGLYPDVTLGIYALPADPTDPAHAWVLPYWRLLAAAHAEEARVVGSPADAVVAVTSSAPNVRALVYERTPDDLFVLAANLGEAPASATLTLLASALGLTGDYVLARVDPTNGAVSPIGRTAAIIETGVLDGWGLAGWRLTK